MYTRKNIAERVEKENRKKSLLVCLFIKQIYLTNMWICLHKYTSKYKYILTRRNKKFKELGESKYRNNSHKNIKRYNVLRLRLMVLRLIEKQTLVRVRKSDIWAEYH